MNTEETKDKRDKAECTELASAFKGFQEMFEKMRKCCMGQDSSIDCSTMMDRMMKEMMESCCEPKADNANSDKEHEKG